MIDIKIDLDVFGLGIVVEQLARIIITNDGTGTVTKGNYKYEIYGKRKQLIKKGKIKDFPRKQQIVTRLLERVLDDAYKNKR